jgi:IS30 family transposase
VHNKLHGFKEREVSYKTTVESNVENDDFVLDKVRPHVSQSGSVETSLNKETRRYMRQQYDDTKRVGGKHWTYKERVKFETLCRELYPCKKKPNFTVLAEKMGKHRTTISREWKRGSCINKNSQLEEFEVYSAEKGQQLADKAARNKGPVGKLTNHIAEAISDLMLENNWSPYVALVALQKEGRHEWLPCEKTVYNAIDAGLMRVNRSDLPYKPVKKRRRRYPKRMAYNNKKGKSISDRPKSANERTEPGHIEIDIVESGKGGSGACLLVITDRMTRYQIICKLKSKTQKEVIRALNRLERMQHPVLQHLKTITCDNGCEFLDHESLEKSVVHKHKKRCEVYYAHPYCASERGSNENANRIIRRFIPKGMDIGKIYKKQIQHIEDWMNALPRKLLNGLTAAEKLELYYKENVA